MARIAVGGFQHKTNTFAPSEPSFEELERAGRVGAVLANSYASLRRERQPRFCRATDAVPLHSAFAPGRVPGDVATRCRGLNGA